MRLKAWSLSVAVLMSLLLGIAVSLTAHGLQAERIDVRKKDNTVPKPAPHKGSSEKDLQKIKEEFGPKANVDHKKTTHTRYPAGTQFESLGRKIDTGKIHLQTQGTTRESKPRHPDHLLVSPEDLTTTEERLQRIHTSSEGTATKDNAHEPSHGELHHVHTPHQPEDPCAKAGSPEKVEACKKASKRFQPSK